VDGPGIVKSAPVLLLSRMSDVLLYDYPGSICSQMARLALEEKGVAYTRQTIDIMRAHEQFEPWYVALNPKSVVPTLRVGDRVICDTLRIVKCVDQQFEGPSLTPSNAETMDRMMREIMGLHYGVLLYSGHLDDNRTSATIIARGEFLREMLRDRPAHAALLQGRIDGNVRMQAILKSETKVAVHLGAARHVVDAIEAALLRTKFVAADSYSLADTFATAALARFRMHGFENWWPRATHPGVNAYLAAMKARPSWARAGVVDAP